jgi:hypothetical protein
MTRKLLAALGAVLFLTGVSATAKHTPKAGSAERKAILDALRPPVEKELGPPVVFVVDVLNVDGTWAFVRGVPQRPAGEAIDYSRTAYREQYETGAFDDWFCALLERRGDGWHVVTYAIGATDVAWEPWAEEHSAPPELFE